MVDISNSRDCRSTIERLVGQAHVRDAAAKDLVEGVQPRWVVEAGSAAEVAGVLAVADAGALRVIPRGGGTKLGWGNPPRAADIILSTKRLDRVLEHAFGDMTASVQAGCTVAAFNRHLSAHDQRLAIDPLWPANATIGGILATNDSGALRANFGALRDQLIGVTVALADGTIAKSGGKVVKNVAGFDLPKLFTGSFGTLGVIVEATFRLYACPKATRVARFTVQNDDQLGRVLTALNARSSLTASVQIEASSDGVAAIVLGIEGLADAIEGKLREIVRAALDAHATREDRRIDSEASAERLFGAGDTCVCKVSLSPTQWPGFLTAVRDVATSAAVRWKVVGQAMGVGLLSLGGSDLERVYDSLLLLRAYLEKSQGSLVVLQGAGDVARRIDAWPQAHAALPLMRRVKAQFDPKTILSPGRFIGGI
ncbi:MAG TPA: FAD-binding oxidoreductase [Tepidisphaeraceae bacterium]|nr:FAD-binding oxidoreductase [Tepidisphaeraceae bacterium]